MVAGLARSGTPTGAFSRLVEASRSGTGGRSAPPCAVPSIRPVRGSGRGRPEGRNTPNGEPVEHDTEMVGMDGGRRPPPRRCGGSRRLPVAPRVAPRDRRRTGRTRPWRARGGGARPARHPAHSRPERGGRALCPWLRPRAGPAVADGDESPNRRGSSRRGARCTRPRHRPAAAGARSLPPGAGYRRASLARRTPPRRRVRERGQRVAGDEDGSAPSRVPDPRVRARPLDGGRHGGVAQGDGPRPCARMDPRPHAPAHVGLPHAGPHPRLLYAVPRGPAPRRRASRTTLRHAGERPRDAAGTLRTAAKTGRCRASRTCQGWQGRRSRRRPGTRCEIRSGRGPFAKTLCGSRSPVRAGARRVRPQHQ